MSRSRVMSCGSDHERSAKENESDELLCNQYDDDLADDPAEEESKPRKGRTSTLSPVRNRRGRMSKSGSESMIERIHRSLSPGTKRRQTSSFRNNGTAAAATTPSRRMPRRKVREEDPKDEQCMEDFEWDEEGAMSRDQQKQLHLLCKEFELFET
jgi:hypothetical protein